MCFELFKELRELAKVPTGFSGENHSKFVGLSENKDFGKVGLQMMVSDLKSPVRC